MKEVCRLRVGDVAVTLLANDHIVRAWRHKKAKNSVKVSILLFQKLTEEKLNEIKSLAEDFGHFLGATKTIIEAN